MPVCRLCGHALAGDCPGRGQSDTGRRPQCRGRAQRSSVLGAPIIQSDNSASSILPASCVQYAGEYCARADARYCSKACRERARWHANECATGGEIFSRSRENEQVGGNGSTVDWQGGHSSGYNVRGWASTTFRFLDFNFATRDRQKAPEIAPLFNAFQRAGPRPENSFLYLLGHIDLASIRASSAP